MNFAERSATQLGALAASEMPELEPATRIGTSLMRRQKGHVNAKRHITLGSAAQHVDYSRAAMKRLFLTGIASLFLAPMCGAVVLYTESLKL